MVKIKTKREVEYEIDIELPYYYKHDLLSDYSDTVIYGKIEENKCTAIIISKDFQDGSIRYEIEIENQKAETSACYMTDEHKSSEEEYNKAKSKLLGIINE